MKSLKQQPHAIESPVSPLMKEVRMPSKRRKRRSVLSGDVATADIGTARARRKLARLKRPKTLSPRTNSLRILHEPRMRVNHAAWILQSRMMSRLGPQVRASDHSP
jgi:hypothetical protein